jgi:hypothetical protein
VQAGATTGAHRRESYAIAEEEVAALLTVDGLDRCQVRWAEEVERSLLAAGAPKGGNRQAPMEALGEHWAAAVRVEVVEHPPQERAPFAGAAPLPRCVCRRWRSSRRRRPSRYPSSWLRGHLRLRCFPRMSSEQWV